MISIGLNVLIKSPAFEHILLIPDCMKNEENIHKSKSSLCFPVAASLVTPIDSYYPFPVVMISAHSFVLLIPEKNNALIINVE